MGPIEVFPKLLIKPFLVHVCNGMPGRLRSVPNQDGATTGRLPVPHSIYFAQKNRQNSRVTPHRAKQVSECRGTGNFTLRKSVKNVTQRKERRLASKGVPGQSSEFSAALQTFLIEIIKVLWQQQAPPRAL